ncbi:MAG: polyprenyl synthetase family protein [Nanoarchaeota archaeon]
MNFQSELIYYKNIINRKLEEFLLSRSSKHDDKLTKYNYRLINDYTRGGKLLRCIGMIKVYEGLTGKKDLKILLPSLCTELFHASSLVHDDIMDEDDVRRNKPSMHIMWKDWFMKNFKEGTNTGSIFSKQSSRFSTSAAIIQGNILFSMGLLCLTTSKFSNQLRNAALDLVQSAYRRVNEGQLLDIINEYQYKSDEHNYIKTAALKTGILFAVSLELGAIFAGGTKKIRKQIHDFGINIAIAFQIQDDIMDISEKFNKGRILGSDIIKGKMTILMINALKNGSVKQKSYLKKIIGKSSATKSEINNVVKIFEDTGALKRSNDLADKYVNDGKKNLKNLKGKLSKECYNFFIQLSDYMTKRII